MNTIGIALLVLGLIGVLIGGYGYYKNKDDADKKKVYTYVGGSASLLLLIGVVMMFMGGDSKNSGPGATTNSTGELSNENLTAAKRAHNDRGNQLQRELNRRLDELTQRQAKLTG